MDPRKPVDDLKELIKMQFKNTILTDAKAAYQRRKRGIEMDDLTEEIKKHLKDTELEETSIGEYKVTPNQKLKELLIELGAYLSTGLINNFDSLKFKRGLEHTLKNLDVIAPSRIQGEYPEKYSYDFQVLNEINFAFSITPLKYTLIEE